MEKVIMKAKNPLYDGMMFGYQFVNGEAKDVERSHAEYMAKNFGVYIVEPEKAEKAEEAPKPRKPRKKAGE